MAVVSTARACYLHVIVVARRFADEVAQLQNRVRIRERDGLKQASLLASMKAGPCDCIGTDGFDRFILLAGMCEVGVEACVGGMLVPGPRVQAAAVPNMPIPPYGAQL